MEPKDIQQFRKVFSGDKLQSVIKNVETRLWWEEIGTTWVPLTQNKTEYDSSWVVSPYAALIIYSKDEMKKLPRPLWGLSILLGPLSWVMKSAAFNQAVSMNNWLLSTNLFSENNNKALADRAHSLIKEFPDYFITIRSLTLKTNYSLIALLKKEGFSFLPSRQVYFFDFNQTKIRKYINFKRDLKLLEKTKYTFVTGDSFSDQDFLRAEFLYRLLYLDKHSSLNPAYTSEYFKISSKTGVIELIGLKNAENQLEGFAGIFSLDKTMSVPFVGYNTKLPMEDGLYRILIAQTLLLAEKRNLQMNLSAGASDFKRVRGGTPETEYTAVYYRHLPWHKRCGFHIVYVLLTFIGMPLIKFLKL